MKNKDEEANFKLGYEMGFKYGDGEIKLQNISVALLSDGVLYNTSIYIVKY